MSEKDYPSRKLDQFVVRFPDGMRDRIRDAAAENKRSMNAEIIATLELAYPSREQQLKLPGFPPEESVDADKQSVRVMLDPSLDPSGEGKTGLAFMRYLASLQKSGRAPRWVVKFTIAESGPAEIEMISSTDQQEAPSNLDSDHPSTLAPSRRRKPAPQKSPPSD